MRFAAIDIGTVTCRMLVAEVVDGRLVELAKEYAITNLGEGVDATGVLSDAAMQRVSVTLDRYLEVLDGFRDADHPHIPLVAMATSASRDARNAADFVEMLAKKGVSLSVIPGQKEASLSFLGASSDFPDENIMVVDIGGGSTEVVVGTSGEEPLRAQSFNVGCRRVTERLLQSDPPSHEEIERARAMVQDAMAPFFEELRAGGFSADRLVAVAGTATSVVSVRDGMETYDSARVHKAEVSRSQLDAVTNSLAEMPLAERESVVGLDPQRAPVIVAGLIILQEVLTLACKNGFTASEADILQGIILEAARS